MSGTVSNPGEGFGGDAAFVPAGRGRGLAWATGKSTCLGFVPPKFERLMPMLVFFSPLAIVSEYGPPAARLKRTRQDGVPGTGRMTSRGSPPSSALTSHGTLTSAFISGVAGGPAVIVVAVAASAGDGAVTLAGALVSTVDALARESFAALEELTFFKAKVPPASTPTSVATPAAIHELTLRVGARRALSVVCPGAVASNEITSRAPVRSSDMRGTLSAVGASLSIFGGRCSMVMSSAADESSGRRFDKTVVMRVAISLAFGGPNDWIAFASSATLAKRSCGTFAKHLKTARSRSLGIFTVRGSGGSSTILANSAPVVAPSKGKFPVTS